MSMGELRHAGQYAFWFSPTCSGRMAAEQRAQEAQGRARCRGCSLWSLILARFESGSAGSASFERES